MSNIKINDVDQRVQYTATAAQTIFSVPFPFFANANVYVWLNGVIMVQGGGAGQYGISGAGSPSGGTITLVTGSAANDIITIEGIMPIDRSSIYSATISNLTGSDLNGDFNREVVMMKQIETTQSLLQLQYAPWSLVSQNDAVTIDRYIPILGANQIWAKNAGNTAFIAYNVPSGGGLAPNLPAYLVQVADAGLPNAQAMGDLVSGIVVNTNATGVQLTRTITGTTNQVSITNGTGIAGNPTIAISANPKLSGTGGLGVPTGTTAERPAAPSGTELRYNTTLTNFEYWDGAAWVQLNDGLDVESLTGTANEILVNGTSGVATNGVITLTVGASLAALSVLAGNGIVVQTGANTFANRTLTGTANEVVVTNGIGVAGNPVLSVGASLAALSVLASTGFIAQTGANTFADRTLTGTANQIDITNTAGVAGNPVFTLSATVDLPGTFAIQSGTAISAIINDATMATALSTNISTSSSTKDYIDAAVKGLNIQGACVAGSTTALTVTYANGAAGIGATLTNAGALAALVLDGITAIVTQRVLIKNQASSLQNGIYTLTTAGTGAVAWVLTRATDFDTPSEIQAGDFVVLTGGTAQVNSGWLQASTVAAVGTDPITFIQFSSSLPVNVTSGGTGAASFTAYAPIMGGITSTAPLQSAVLGASGTLMRSAGAGALPGFTTTTYPATNAINTIMYATSANVLGVITPVNSAVLITSAAGVPSFSTTLPSGIAATNMVLTTPTLGAATATSITFSPTTGGIVGTTTNNNADAGIVGEFISSNIAVASSVNIANNTATNLTSISLTAGDWIVGGNVRIVNTGQNLTRHIVWTSITSATTPNVSNAMEFDGNTATYLTGGGVAPLLKVSITGGAISVYASAFTTFGAGTASMCGNIWARRLR